MRKVASAIALAVLSAGCFNEPEPAYKSVPAEARVYLNARGFKDLKGVKSWGGSIGADKVDYVNLDYNQLTNVDEVSALTGLKWLRLNENRLSALPSLDKLVHLRRIYLRDNRLSEVPATLKDLQELTDIELSGNPIAEVPEWLAKKTGLKNLSFNRTRLNKLPDDLSAWEGLQSLQLGELDLSAAEMARIRKALPKVAIVF